MMRKPLRTIALIAAGLTVLTFPVWGPINSTPSFAKTALLPCDPLTDPLTCLTPNPTDTALPTLPTGLPTLPTGLPTIIPSVLPTGVPTLPPPLPACARVLRGFATSCRFLSTGGRLVVGGIQIQPPTIFIPNPPLIPVPLPDPLPTPIVTLPSVRIEIEILRLNGQILVECRGSGTLIAACLEFGHYDPIGEILECRARWPGFGAYACASYPNSLPPILPPLPPLP